MGFLNRMKGVFSTGQASAVDEARRLHKGGDIAGAVSLLKQTLEARTESGKALAVIRELHDAYSTELNLNQLEGYRETLSASPFDLADYDRIDGIMTSLNRALRDNAYSGKARSEAEALYKEFHERFQKLRIDAQQKRQSEILKTLELTDPDKNADTYVTLVEELRGVGGRLPEGMDADYRAAQERSYILPDNLKEFDNYVIERSLGRGGFASVFLASPKGVSFQAALKIFSPDPSLVRESGLSLSELKERFRREAGIMLRLSTERIPGIVNARHTETWRGKPYLAMDYYPKNLSALIGSDDDLLQTGRGGYLSFDNALAIITDILTSIHRLHTRKNPVIHRDLKPANILLDKDNRPYIGDFGLARETSRADLLSKAFQTATGTHLATQYYGAPEQRGGFKETDQRADVFSLGVIIYRMLTGRLIGFHDLEPIELYVQGLDKDTADRINDLLNKATRIEVDQRLADVSTLLEVFSPEQASVEISQAPTGPTAEHQFLSALEMAYSFAPDGKLPDNVRATLIAKSHELGIGRTEAELLEKDFRDRLGLSKATGGRVVSATAGAGLKTGEEKDVGTLVITSEPEMATVTVDGMERGKTPLTIDRIGAGNRTVRLKMDGFFPVSRIERILPDKETKIHIILEHQTGSINVTARTFSDAYPARFYLDGKLMGRPPLTVQDITAGTHTYSHEADHHEKYSGEITVILDQEVKIDESLKPLPGILTLKSTPPGAVIWVNGRKSKQKTDVRFKIPAGKHAITLKLDSYVDVTKEVEVFPGSTLEEQFRLIRNQGKINVVSIPEGADIWIDGNDTGKKTDDLVDVVAGEHEITLKLDGYKDANKKINLVPEGFVEVEARLEKGANVPPPEPTFVDPITGMEFVYVPGGKFMMGDIFGDGDEDERPVHEVTLDGFYIGKYPVTQGQWQKVMGYNPSESKKGDGYPVEKVSWQDAQRFIEKLISMNNAKYHFQLPTEAEWEYAARSGGKNERYAGGDDLDAVAWYRENSGGNTHSVGKKLPNGLGLYDVCGNVYEWCQDNIGPYPSISVVNPKGPSLGHERVIRGGSWGSNSGGGLDNPYDNLGCRLASRFSKWPFMHDNETGFRLALKQLRKLSKHSEIESNEDYAVYANGIMKDKMTGLEWLAGPDMDTAWDEVTSWVYNVNIGGGGWRLPTIDELESLYKKAVDSQNMTPLLRTNGSWSWAETETEGSPKARIFHFWDGRKDWMDRSGSQHGFVFAVRSRNEGFDGSEFGSEKSANKTAPAQRTIKEIRRDGSYIAYNNGIVKDTHAGLEWKVGPDEDTNWKQATSWVKGLDLDKGGWRMPTTDELEGVYKKGSGDRNMSPLFKTSGWWVWSGETKGISNARIFSFYDGTSAWLARKNSIIGRAFAVRSQSKLATTAIPSATAIIGL